MKLEVITCVAVLTLGASLYGFSTAKKIAEGIPQPFSNQHSFKDPEGDQKLSTYTDEIVGYSIDMPYDLTAHHLSKASWRKAQRATMSARKSRSTRDPRGQTTTAFRDDGKGILVTIVTEDLSRVSKSRTEQSSLLNTWTDDGYGQFEVKGTENAFLARATVSADQMATTKACKKSTKSAQKDRKSPSGPGVTATAEPTASPCQAHRRLARRVVTGEHSYLVTAQYPNSASDQIVKDLEAMANSLASTSEDARSKVSEAAGAHAN